MEIIKEDIKNYFLDDWGDVSERFLRKDLVKIFKEIGIDVLITIRKIRSYNENIEFGPIAISSKEVIILNIEYLPLKIRDINEFINQLSRFKEAFPEYKNFNVYGAVAFMYGSPEVTRYAYRKGLFVIKAINKGAQLLNDKKFKPKSF